MQKKISNHCTAHDTFEHKLPINIALQISFLTKELVTVLFFVKMQLRDTMGKHFNGLQIMVTLYVFVDL